MSLQTFNPAVNPSYNYRKATETRILRTEFGDGYTQRAADGLNSIKKVVDLAFQNVTKTNADAIETFFTARGGWEAFNYTLPDESSARKFIAEKWERQATGPNLFTVHVTLEEVFDI
jgi:phage-related protein